MSWYALVQTHEELPSTNDLAKKVVAELEKPSAFEEGDDYIKIGDVKYTKKAD